MIFEDFEFRDGKDKIFDLNSLTDDELEQLTEKYGKHVLINIGKLNKEIYRRELIKEREQKSNYEPIPRYSNFKIIEELDKGVYVVKHIDGDECLWIDKNEYPNDSSAYAYYLYEKYKREKNGT
jgi:hypothetical protein